jgi:hypothetical protein
MLNGSRASGLFVLALAALLAAAMPAACADRCERLLNRLGNQLADANCFESTDLTTNNPLTTLNDNSLSGLPVGAFTPTTDRTVISPSAPNRTPITKMVPGVQLNARIADDPEDQARRRCQINLRRAAGTRSRMRIHAAATAFRHSLAASARKIRSVDRETRWR